MSARCYRSFLHLVLLFFTLVLPLSAQEQGPFEVTSLIGKRLFAERDDETISSAKRRSISKGSQAVADYISLSKAEAGRRQYREAVNTASEGLAKFPENADLLLERGHRELGLRDFLAAQKDLERALKVDPDKLDIHYHLGLALYFQGNFAEAATHFGHARDLAKTDDSLIDCSNWLYVSLRRAGQEKEAAKALSPITPSVHNTEPHLAFYLRLLRFYQGQVAEREIIPTKPTPGDTELELSYNTISYGLGNWHLYNGDTSGALSFFRNVISGEAWNSWGYIGSETELARH